ncbi:ATP-dependent DNA helicase [Prochlorococcus marinus]|uniref:ATP-dependent DNA helicase n=1 Tax=Prochlorococcus TaxID=1218 RepID=UPI0007B395AE|nr:AAA family ATPase [Prochlorococcus marinus]KZR76668.1 RecBCD enzyme subunit RecD [Prochlorococcus marinus str. MIT 1323]
MTRSDLSTWPSGFPRALHQTLLRRFPPKASSIHLEDLVNALMDALARGELQLNLTAVSPPQELKAMGWPEAHYQALLASGWLEGAASPMVLNGNQLSWRRWHGDMDVVIKELINRSNVDQPTSICITPSQHPALLDGLNPEQQAAVEAIDHHGVVLLSGGPGTGKTSTIVQMLARAVTLRPGLKIGLAAPTGKAARRLEEAVRKGLETISPPQRQALTSLPCSTLHRWLQARPGGFARHQQHPLMLDLLVIDEMSMVDLTLMQALLNALPVDSQLVMIGDPDQLPPVGSGAVWHQLQQADIRQQFNHGAIHLHQLYRNRGSLATLSRVLCDQGLSAFWQQLSLLPKSANVEQHQCNLSSMPSFLVQHLQEHSRTLQRLTAELMLELPDDAYTSTMLNTNLAVAAESLLDSLERLMVLCPKRRGFWGVDHVHRALLGQSLEAGVMRWPLGTPVMCCENQAELGLANGDVGLVVGQGDNLRILFRVISEQGGLTTRFIHPARLSVVEPALALTVHKSQGSEADHVILLWPEITAVSATSADGCESASRFERKLLYTAITRARQRVDLITAMPSARSDG